MVILWFFYLGLGIDLSSRVNVNSANNLGSVGGLMSQLLGVRLQELLQVQSVHRDSRSIIFLQVKRALLALLRITKNWQDVSLQEQSIDVLEYGGGGSS